MGGSREPKLGARLETSGIRGVNLRRTSLWWPDERLGFAVQRGFTAHGFAATSWGNRGPQVVLAEVTRLRSQAR
jgi:hypothetical protein